jgi:hypothetical protein
MKIKTSELKGTALDWAVAVCEESTLKGVEDITWMPFLVSHFQPSTNWQQGGEIIEREKITLVRCDDDYISDSEGFTTTQRVPVWFAEHGGDHSLQEDYSSQGDYRAACFHISNDGQYGQTPLIAAMRCYVCSKLGDFVEVPDELIKD